MHAARITIPLIIEKHAEDAAFLWLLRDAAVSAPHYRLRDLADLDNRVEAHIDGLRIAGKDGWAACLAGLEAGEPGEVFAASVLAFESGDGRRIDTVLEAALAQPGNFRALVSALGWVDYAVLDGLPENLLAANSDAYRRVGIAACAIHRRDPGERLQQLLQCESPDLLARACKAAGELNRRDLLNDLRAHWQSEHDACRYWSAWSSVLLGDTGAVKPLMAFVNFGTCYRPGALELAMRVLDPGAARNWLAGLWQDAGQRRYALTGAGIIGNPRYIPALIEQMVVPELARAAGEAFSLITGVDIAYQDLEGEWPEGFEAGPTENPEDENVELDIDEDLPWPDPVLVQGWWEANRQQFAGDARYLCGQPVSTGHCAHVLGAGFQRQRKAAALELALLQADAPLIETRAPGFRQQQLARQGG